MTTATLTAPTLTAPTLAASTTLPKTTLPTTATAHFPAVTTPWRTLRQLTAAAWRERAARRAVARALGALDQAVVDPRPLVLEGFHELANGRELLESLHGRHGLRVVLRGRASAFLEHTTLLARLDRDHAVELVLEAPLDEPSSRLSIETSLSAARELASLGLSVRLTLPTAAAGCRLRPMVEAASAAGVEDLEWADGASAASGERLARLRAASGFPRRSAGRG